MNYDAFIDKWVDKLNKFFFMLNNFDDVPYLSGSEEDRPQATGNRNLKTDVAMLLFNASQLPTEDMLERKKRVIEHCHTNASIASILDELLADTAKNYEILKEYFSEYFASSIILAVYNYIDLTYGEYTALLSFIRDDILKNPHRSMAYMGDMMSLMRIIMPQPFNGWILMDDESEKMLCEQVCRYTDKDLPEIYSFVKSGMRISDAIFINMLYCDTWSDDEYTVFSNVVKTFKEHNGRTIYVLADIYNIITENCLERVGIDYGHKTNIKNVRNNKCVVVVDLQECSDTVDYEQYEFDFQNMSMDYAHIRDLRKHLRISKSRKIPKDRFVEEFKYELSSENWYDGINMSDLIMQKIVDDKLPEGMLDEEVAFYNIDPGRRVIHKLNGDISYSHNKSVCTADDFDKIRLVRSLYDQGNLRYVDEPTLIVNKRYYLPTYFTPTKGPILIDISENDLYTITYLVLPEYLVNEMNKPEFIIKYVDAKYAELSDSERIDDLLLSDFKLPEGLNSQERQKQLYLYDQQIYVKKLVSEFGFQLNSAYDNSNSDLPKGTVLYDDKGVGYVIQEKIGEGGFSKTYKAGKLQPKEVSGFEMPEQVVAIKEFFIKGIHRRNGTEVELLLNDHGDEAKKAMRKFWDEAKKISKLADCDNIISVYNVFDRNGTCYYSMEYVDGPDLSYYCKEKPSGHLSCNEAVRIILELCCAVKALHDRQMNHFDIKPENILIGAGGHVKLIDFGTACQFVADSSTSTILPVESSGYTPLELRTLTSFSPQSDIYSIGATLYNILTGWKVPSAADLAQDFSRLKRPDDIDDGIWNAIVMAIAPDPDCRPATVDDFVLLLEVCRPREEDVQLASENSVYDINLPVGEDSRSSHRQINLASVMKEKESVYGLSYQLYSERKPMPQAREKYRNNIVELLEKFVALQKKNPSKDVSVALCLDYDALIYRKGDYLKEDDPRLNIDNVEINNEVFSKYAKCRALFEEKVESKVPQIFVTINQDDAGKVEKMARLADDYCISYAVEHGCGTNHEEYTKIVLSFDDDINAAADYICTATTRFLGVLANAPVTGLTFSSWSKRKARREFRKSNMYGVFWFMNALIYVAIYKLKRKIFRIR